MAKICIYCRSRIAKPSSNHDDLCAGCYMLVKIAERKEGIGYLCD